MNMIVLMKQTFDTEEKIALENNDIREDGVEFIINPYDEYAIEEALKIREEQGGEVTVITVGPDRSESALRTALAMGADKAVLIDDEGLAGDEYGTAKIIAAAIQGREYDLILAGNMSIDNGSGQIGPRVAELLQIPQITTITKLDIQNGKAVAERDVEGNIEVIEAPLPLLVTAQQGLNEPRYPSLPNIMKAKKKPLERLTIADLSLQEDEVQSKSTVTNRYLPQKKAACRMIEGGAAEQVKELVNILESEVKGM
ncbi:electron transfer flavoprotein subunit beta/FixA family protein [Brevibacillus massiliensis]|jgi:electron transfer flavoprotein beta subunit|uniref:electron transfer flavoprotein subunit beta/FixA family protein n=1 Tax=Brevibacillus massiliensis TaxID=1118054 RepID=UPI000363CEFD|nr:electron transfer flavoprotein subunit beta/FixA family protein [Brevibacillus massiliensis]